VGSGSGHIKMLNQRYAGVAATHTQMPNTNFQPRDPIVTLHMWASG